MPTRSVRRDLSSRSSCSITRAVAVIPDDWSYLLVKEALLGRRTFAEFRDVLGVATDVLTTRLSWLVDGGVLVKVPYREPGQRERFAYDLTASGKDLIVPLIALQQWGDRHRPSAEPSAVVPVAASSGELVRVALVDEVGDIVSATDVRFVRRGDGGSAGQVTTEATR